MTKYNYTTLPRYSQKEVLQIVSGGDADSLSILPLSIGEYGDEQEFAEHICLQLCQHPEENIRANAFLGLSYIARNHNRLNKKLVSSAFGEVNAKDYLNPMNFGKIQDAAEDINLFLKWDLVL